MRFLKLCAAILPAVGLQVACERAPEARAPLNVIMVMVDTLRPDHLGVYGYPKDTSPNIDQFAAESIVFKQAIAQASHTSPSIAALFTSKYPGRAGLLHKNLGVHDTLAERFARVGYKTYGAVSNPIIASQSGYRKGFEVFKPAEWEDAEQLVDYGLGWLTSEGKSEPFFMYLHFMDVHGPYTPPAKYRRRFAPPYSGPVNGRLTVYKRKMQKGVPLNQSEEDEQELLGRYDGEIAYFDDQFGRFCAQLKRLGLYESSIIVFVSDHGEELLDHDGVGHGHTLYDELIRVPLMIRKPGEPAGTYDGLVEVIDIAPSLFEMLQLPMFEDVQGRSFVRSVSRQEPFKEHAFSEVNRQKGLRAGSHFVSVRTKNDKFIFAPNTGKRMHFDLVKDSREQSQLPQSPRWKQLDGALQKWVAQYGSEDWIEEYDEHALEALRSLGYVK